VINRYGASALREEVLGTADTYLIARVGHPLLAESTLPFRSLDGVPLVLPATPNGLRAALDQLARRHRVELSIVMEVESGGTMKDVALSGHACTLLPLMAVKEEIGRGRLGAARVIRPGIRRTIALALTTQRPLSRAARHVAARIRAIAPGLVG
jgi:LysR family transcriptional regulator, nitrogen assimilation regulatory protein